MPATKDINTIEEYNNILKVAEGYVEGLKSGNVEVLKKTFHQDGIMVGYMPDGNLIKKLQFLFDFTNEHGEAPNVKSHISILHKTETAAIALVELEDLQGGVGSTDYLSLLKVDGQWKVISKIFNLYWQ